MKYTIDPGKERRSINVVDSIVYSHVTDRNGNPVDLEMCLYLQNGNSEMRLASGKDDEVSTGKQPCIIWINGAGWHDVDKLIMAAEMQFLAEAGYAMAFIKYRGSETACFPAQLIDCKTAVRFIRAHADQYGIDASRIGIIGRSAGGHLTAWMCSNTEGFDSEEWAGYSSEVQCGVDMFGPVDIPACSKINFENVKNPNFRWHKMADTHEGKLLGFTDDMTEEEMLEIGRKASPLFAINEKMAPITIMHGDEDPLVPCFISEEYYDALVAAGYGDQTDLYILKHGGHGTREFFQGSTKKIIVEAFDKYLK